MPSFFTNHLLQWHAENPRPLPWDGGPRDAYHIWISEIIMQQTRIEQGAPYYLKFINRFPSVEALASASQDEVIRYWQGLGYYSRARNIHSASRYIVEACNGIFPATYDDLLRLPGVGPYSAAAIASFAYGLSYPVVDGNVKRVIARFTGISSSIDESTTHEKIRLAASGWMKGVSAAEFNQAIMNFGAIICTPGKPDCASCPLSRKCYAYIHDMVSLLPARTKKKVNTLRHFHFIVIHWRGKVLLQRREGKDIWRDLYAPPLIESASSRKPNLASIKAHVERIIGHNQLEFVSSSEAVQQLLSHQTIVGRFHAIHLLSAPQIKVADAVWVTSKTIDQYGKPKMVVAMLEKTAADNLHRPSTKGQDFIF